MEGDPERGRKSLKPPVRKKHSRRISRLLRPPITPMVGANEHASSSRASRFSPALQSVRPAGIPANRLGNHPVPPSVRKAPIAGKSKPQLFAALVHGHLRH